MPARPNVAVTWDCTILLYRHCSANSRSRVCRTWVQISKIREFAEHFSRHRRRNSLLGNDEKSGAVGRQTNHNPYSTQMFFFQTHGLDNSTQQLYSESLPDIKSSESTSEDSREHPRRTFQTFLLPRLNVNRVRLVLQLQLYELTSHWQVIH